ncbi:MAG: hypothetical protein P8I99_14755 [Acidimicrobiales bacterium]|nr:hypothetical protein [Acidimicrobiales bacterium]MDG1878666.1 hypothetical protein [Acidimicrobiales bacterium]
MRRLFGAVKFFMTDMWASRKEAVAMPERREYYRDSSDIYGRGLGGADSPTIRSHTKGILKPPTD